MKILNTFYGNIPLTTLWDGSGCGREECITCTQGAEMYPPCTQRSVLYENMCGVCNQGAKEAREIKTTLEGAASIYVGETGRSIQERGEEHWAAYRTGSTKSHILKHQNLEHGGAAPQFIMRAVSFHKTALSRQVASSKDKEERRGGSYT